MVNLWRRFVTNNNFFKIENKEYRQVFLINNALLLMSFVFFVFIILNLVISDYLTSGIMLAAFTISLFIIVLFHKTNNVKITSVFTVIVLTLTVGIFILNANNCDHSFFWIVVLPPFALTLLGIKWGSLLSISLIAYFIFGIDVKNITEPLDFSYKSYVNIAAALMVLMIEIIYIEYGRRETQNFLAKKNIDIEILSITDKLTGLYNRQKLDEVFLKEIQNKNFSVIFADLDQFKRINDTFGHTIGDEVLQSVAQIIKNEVSDSATPGRWGGEEFLIICPNNDISNTLVVAEKIRKTIQEKNFNGITDLTMSLGVSTYKEGDTKDSMLKRADEALYHSKKMGKNRVITF